VPFIETSFYFVFEIQFYNVQDFVSSVKQKERRHLDGNKRVSAKDKD